MLRPSSIARLLALAAPFAPATAGLIALAGCDRQNPAQPQAERGAADGGVAGGGAAGKDAGASQPTGRVDISHRGEAMPAAGFLGPDDKPVALPAFRGRPLLVNFWATWCGPCVKEMPTLDALAGREATRFRLIAVSQDIGGRYVVGPYFAKARFANLQPYLDKENVLMDAAKTDTLPTTIFYDAVGIEQWRVIGTLDWSGGRAKTLIDGALGVAGRG